MPRVLWAALTTATIVAAAVAQQAPASSPQHPVFRAGAMLVYVDAYPTRDGQVVDNLTRDQFHVLEDGVPQQIEFFEQVRFAPNPADSLRHDPSTAEEGDRLAGDPRHRAFIVYFDVLHLTADAARRMRQPVVEFLQRTIGPDDYFGVLNARTPASDLVFGQRTETIADAVDRYWVDAADAKLDTPMDAHEEWLEGCYIGRYPDLDRDKALIHALFARWRMHLVLQGLSDLADRVRMIREERTNVLLFSGGWTIDGPDAGLDSAAWGVLSQPGVAGGRVTMSGQPTGAPDFSRCDANLKDLASMDFRADYQRILTAAKRANLTFYTIDPGGLGAFDFDLSTNRGVNYQGVEAKLDALRGLALGTNGTFVDSTMDLRTPLEAISNELSSYYLLGYYTTNTKLDGKYRSIRVRVDAPGVKVAARDGYLAPTEASLNGPAPPAAGTTAADEAAHSVGAAMAPLARLDTSEELFVSGAASSDAVTIFVELASRARSDWANGGDLHIMLSAGGAPAGVAEAKLSPGDASMAVQVPIGAGAGPWQARVELRGDAGRLTGAAEIASDNGPLGAPLLFRAAAPARAPFVPVADHLFSRSERVRVECEVRGTIDNRLARLLGPTGQPLAVPVAVTVRTANGRQLLDADLTLAPLAPGDYVVEVTAAHGAETTRRLAAIRVER